MGMLQTFSSCAGNDDVAVTFENYWLTGTFMITFQESAYHGGNLIPHFCA